MTLVIDWMEGTYTARAPNTNARLRSGSVVAPTAARTKYLHLDE